MARKKGTLELEIVEIQSNMDSDKLVIGTKLTLKELKKGTVDKVFVTKNCPSDVLGDIEHYAGINDISVIKLNRTNQELGVLCKKSYMVSVLCLKKDE